MRGITLVVVLTFFGFGSQAFGEGWLPRVVGAKRVELLRGESQEMSRSICLWQIKLKKIPSECYRLLKKGRAGAKALARLDAICEKAFAIAGAPLDSPKGARESHLSPKCRARALKIAQIAAYRERSGDMGGEPSVAWPEY